MPYGDPAGYLPRVKRARKRKGGLQTVKVGPQGKDPARSFQPVTPPAGKTGGSKFVPAPKLKGGRSKPNMTGGFGFLPKKKAGGKAKAFQKVSSQLQNSAMRAYKPRKKRA